MKRESGGHPWLWAPVVLAIDFATKRLVLAHVDRLQPPVDILGDIARFTYVRNPGAAMGLVFGGRPLLIGISALATVVLALLYLRTRPAHVIRRCAVAAILGGAVGNLVDRIFYDGLVVDFIDLGLGVHRFYTFNVADMGVTLGGLVLFLSLWREGRETDPAAVAAETPDPVATPTAIEDDA